MKCIECGKENVNNTPVEDGKWCSMECKEKTFINNFENSQWVYRLLETKTTELLKRVEAGLLFPFEGSLISGIEMTRPTIVNMQRDAFNRIGREFRV